MGGKSLDMTAMVYARMAQEMRNSLKIAFPTTVNEPVGCAILSILLGTVVFCYRRGGGNDFKNSKSSRPVNLKRMLCFCIAWGLGPGKKQHFVIFPLREGGKTPPKTGSIG